MDAAAAPDATHAPQVAAAPHVDTAPHVETAPHVDTAPHVETAPQLATAPDIATARQGATLRPDGRIPLRMVVMVGALAAFGPLCIDMYLPALPAISDDLLSGASAVQLSLTACLIGLALGQLLVGPISDRLGRRRPLIAGIALFLLASLACAVAPSIQVLIAFRLLQGFGGAAGVVISRAIVRDLYSGAAAARFFSMIMLVMGAAPILAPQLGAWLLHLGPWRVLFVALAALGAVLLAMAALRLPETLPQAMRSDGGVGHTLRTMRRIGGKRVFLASALAGGFGFGALFAYVSGSSFVMQDVYGLSPQTFSAVFALNAVGMIGASQVNARLVRRIPPTTLLTIGLCGIATGSIGILLMVALGAGLGGILACLFVVLSSNGFVMPNAMALALNEFPEAAGSASALLGVLQFSIGAIVAPLVGLGGDDTAWPMAIVMASLGASGICVRVGLLTSRRGGARSRRSAGGG